MAPFRHPGETGIRAAILAALLLFVATTAAGGAESPSAGPPGPPPTPEHEPGTLQALVDAAADGAVVEVPAGLYRERVRITRPVTLLGAGAEIRGSDVWADWRPDGDGWLSDEAVPELRGGGECREPRCAWPEQVFVDGVPLLQVAADPAVGQFSLDADRRVRLADDPSDRLVEVTVRERWLVVEAPDVVVEGFTMRHAASRAQNGALQAQPDATGLAIRDVRLSDAHGALVSFQGVTGASLRSSELTRGGQLGVHAGGSGTTGLLIEDNRITGNNTEGFDPAWEAGGLKAALSTDLQIIDNEVTGNGGPGVWCDIDCRDFVVRGNRLGGNEGPGAMFEISDGALIEGNVVWENGWGHPTWGWGAGILVSSSTGATVRDNLLAWNADGITIVSQVRNRDAGDGIRDTTVTGNTVIGDASSGYLLAWLQDWPGPMHGTDARNTGSGNRFWHATAEPSPCRFEWTSCLDRLADFAATPGGAGSAYLTDDEVRAALGGSEVPEEPIAHSPDEPPRTRTVVIAVAAAGGGALLLAGLLVLVLRRRRRRRAA